METLPEFRVTLTRLKEGETAYPGDGPHYETHGQRTKLGGELDWVQSGEVPFCSNCGELMSFVAQIDSWNISGNPTPTQLMRLPAIRNGCSVMLE